MKKYSVVCSEKSRYNIWNDIEECDANLVKGSKPMVIFTKEDRPMYCCILLDEFMELINNEK